MVTAALVSAVLVVLQFWFAVVFFCTDLPCHAQFANANATLNQILCEASLANVSQSYCQCRNIVGGTIKSSWTRCLDEWSLFLASCVFISLVIIECFRVPHLMEVIFSFKNKTSTFGYLSFFGFLALILNPKVLMKQKHFSHNRMWLLIPNIFIIVLDFRYCAFTATSTTNTFVLACLIFTILDVIICFANTFVTNYKTHPNINK